MGDSRRNSHYDAKSYPIWQERLWNRFQSRSGSLEWQRLAGEPFFAYGISGLIAGCRPDGAGAHGRADGRKHLQAIYNRSTGDSGCTVSAERRVPRARSLVHCIMTTIGTGGNLLGIDAFTLRLRSKRLLIFLFGSIGFEKGELLCKAIVAVDEASSSTGFCH
jgi:hypothetical protein